METPNEQMDTKLISELNISPFQLENKKNSAEIAEMINDQDDRNFKIVDIDLNSKKFHSIILFKDFKYLHQQSKIDKVFKLLFASDLQNLDLLEKFIYNDFTQIPINFEKIFPFFKLVISIEDEGLAKEILIYIDLSVDALKQNFTNSDSLSFLLSKLLDFLNFLKAGKVFQNQDLYEATFKTITSMIKTIISNCLNNDNCNAMFKTLKSFFLVNSIINLNSEIMNQISSLFLKLPDITLEHKIEFLKIYEHFHDLDSPEAKVEFLKNNLKLLVFAAKEDNFEEPKKLYEETIRSLNIKDVEEEMKRIEYYTQGISSNKRVDVLKAINEDLKNTNSNTKSELDKLKVKYEDTLSELDTINLKNKELMFEKSKLTSDYEALNNSKEVIQSELDSIKLKKEEVLKENSQLNSNYELLKNENSQLYSEIDDIKESKWIINTNLFIEITI